ncbi:hypothetical protein B0T24DRAFT_592625 [Lasiosphaeria ovina]|uniref:Uncharacterized protein n=1 Tax=Lasiosphaeria ovina TaxID=92902 RepID=A0AAE0NB71_9PEZI|nr:hypothetical protein B0T24DRAFT_592625 [Lasiosphaeria ovina]
MPMIAAMRPHYGTKRGWDKQGFGKNHIRKRSLLLLLLGTKPLHLQRDLGRLLGAHAEIGAAFGEAMWQFFGDNRPAVTVIVVKEIMWPGARIEIQSQAVLHD